jgi:hypothetical protein
MGLLISVQDFPLPLPRCRYIILYYIITDGLPPRLYSTALYEVISPTLTRDQYINLRPGARSTTVTLIIYTQHALINENPNSKNRSIIFRKSQPLVARAELTIPMEPSSTLLLLRRDGLLFTRFYFVYTGNAYAYLHMSGNIYEMWHFLLRHCLGFYNLWHRLLLPEKY